MSGLPRGGCLLHLLADLGDHHLRVLLVAAVPPHDDARKRVLLAAKQWPHQQAVWSLS